jgi:hypothetical protein
MARRKEIRRSAAVRSSAVRFQSCPTHGAAGAGSQSGESAQTLRRRTTGVQAAPIHRV